MHSAQPPYPPAPANLASALIANSGTPLLLLDENLDVAAASPSFCAAFDVDPATCDCSLAELGSGEWNIPQLLSLLKVTASGVAQIDEFALDLIREGLPTRHLIVSAKALHCVEKTDACLMLTACDVTETRNNQKRTADLLQQKDILLQEQHHRIANSLQIIASVLMQSARKAQYEETRRHLQDTHNRVMSVAALQQQLATSKLGDVELRPYLLALCESIRTSLIHDHDQISLDVRADDSVAPAHTSVGLGLIVTELVINALKHAFLGNPKGKIWVDYRARGPNWTLSVGDDGVGMPADPATAKAGLGTSIVRALAQQLSAQIKIAATNPGTTVSIEHACVPVLVERNSAHANRAA